MNTPQLQADLAKKRPRQCSLVIITTVDSKKTGAAARACRAVLLELEHLTIIPPMTATIDEIIDGVGEFV